MTERVAPSLAGIRWEPNSRGAVLIVTDDGLTALALNPYPGDAGDDCVVLVWSGTQEAPQMVGVQVIAPGWGRRGGAPWVWGWYSKCHHSLA